MQTIRIQVETNDGCRTIWYEKSKLKNPTDAICKRVNEQLAGLNLKRVEVSLSPATIWIMTLSKDQLSKLTLMYAERVVDNMDVRDLCAFAIDTIVDNMDDYNESELMEELSHYYDDEELQELIEEVTQTV